MMMIIKVLITMVRMAIAIFNDNDNNKKRIVLEQEATIRIDNDCSVYKTICRGVRQGWFFRSRPLKYLQRNDSTEHKAP